MDDVSSAAHSIRVATEIRVECKSWETLKRGSPFPCLLDGGRCAEADEAASRREDGPRACGMENVSWSQVTRYRPSDGSHASQRQELAEHALVHPVRQLRQMAVTLVLHAFGARPLGLHRCLMNVERRDEQHRQIYSQQHPGSDMSLRHYVHDCKITKKNLHSSCFILLFFCNFAFVKIKTNKSTNEEHPYYRLNRTDWF